MQKLRTLCLFSNLLGNKATAAHLRGALERQGYLDLTIESLTVEDTARIPVPAYARLTNPWWSQYLAQQKFGKRLGEPFDLMFTNAWEFAIPLAPFAKRVPSAILMDAVPATVNQQLKRVGAPAIRRAISYLTHHTAFRRAIREFRYFLPMGSDCKNALVNVYGVPSDRCSITLAPQDTSAWYPNPRKSTSQPFRLLFVGNDFRRKGGRLLLELYERCLADKCTLTIASNDPAIAEFELPSGVEWLKGKSREELLGVYRQSDLFVFPTRQDFMPQVLAESLAAGLPVAASNVGGISDLVKPGRTGLLLAPDASIVQWAQQIHGLIEDEALLATLRQGARNFAEENLSLERFARTVEAAVACLRREVPGFEGG